MTRAKPKRNNLCVWDFTNYGVLPSWFSVPGTVWTWSRDHPDNRAKYTASGQVILSGYSQIMLVLSPSTYLILWGRNQGRLGDTRVLSRISPHGWGCRVSGPCVQEVLDPEGNPC